MSLIHECDCGKEMKVSGPGAFKCPSCGSRFTIADPNDIPETPDQTLDQTPNPDHSNNALQGVPPVPPIPWVVTWLDGYIVFCQVITVVGLIGGLSLLDKNTPLGLATCFASIVWGAFQLMLASSAKAIIILLSKLNEKLDEKK